VAVALLVAVLAAGCGKTDPSPMPADALANALTIIKGCGRSPLRRCEDAHRAELEADRREVCGARGTGHGTGAAAEAQPLQGAGLCAAGTPLRSWVAVEYVRLAGSPR
jgi:hypothetical protein